MPVIKRIFLLYHGLTLLEVPSGCLENFPLLSSIFGRMAFLIFCYSVQISAGILRKMFVPSAEMLEIFSESVAYEGFQHVFFLDLCIYYGTGPSRVSKSFSHVLVIKKMTEKYILKFVCTLP